MGETAVELFLEVEVIEGVNEVSPVEMGIDPKHLSKDSLANIHEVFREATSLADPISVAGVGQLCQWRGSDGWVVCKGNAADIGREDVGIIDFARDPTLHQRDILVGRKLNGLPLLVEPSK